MSHIELPGARDDRRAHESDAMPPAMLFAIVAGVGVVIVWALGALLVIHLLGVTEVNLATSLIPCVFAAGANVIGVIGCRRRWVWVRWAALLQAVVVTAVAVPSWLDAPNSTGLIAVFVAYAGLQFAPSSHRWYHPKCSVASSTRGA